MSQSHRSDFATVDYNAVYEGGQLLPGVIKQGVPWDIGAPQPAVVAFEKAGRFAGEVLDVGCGLGDNAIYLARQGHHVTGVDAASTAITHAKERAGDIPVSFAVADATALTGYEGAFDSVLDSAFYHSLDETGRQLYIRALHRATRPGAKLSMLCFAAVEGGMPTPMSVPEGELRAALAGAGWDVTFMQVTTYWGVASVMAGFLAQFGLTPPTDEDDHIHVPVWQVEADRA